MSKQYCEEPKAKKTKTDSLKRETALPAGRTPLQSLVLWGKQRATGTVKFFFTCGVEAHACTHVPFGFLTMFCSPAGSYLAIKNPEMGRKPFIGKVTAHF